MQLCVRNSSKNGTGVRSADARTSPWTVLAPGNLCIIDHGWQMLVPLKGGLGKDRKSLVDRVLIVLLDRREVPNGDSLEPTLVLPSDVPPSAAKKNRKGEESREGQEERQA